MSPFEDFLPPAEDLDLFRLRNRLRNRMRPGRTDGAITGGRDATRSPAAHGTPGWRQALRVPPGKAPTLTDPAAAYDLGGGESLEVHKGDGATYRPALVRRKGGAEAFRLLL